MGRDTLETSLNSGPVGLLREVGRSRLDLPVALSQRTLPAGALLLVAAVAAVSLAAPAAGLRRTVAGGQLDAQLLTPALDEAHLGFSRSVLEGSARRTGSPAPPAAIMGNSLVLTAVTSVGIVLLALGLRVVAAPHQPSLRGPPVR